MHRVDTLTAAAALPAANPAGTPGYFTQGDLPGGIPATVPGQDWFNSVQEELINLLDEAEITPDKDDNTQLFQAIMALALFQSGTKMWFWQNVAPEGWTIDATAADTILAVKGGVQAYNANGGTKFGTWTQPDHNHATAGHTLTVDEIPSHYHEVTGNVGTLSSTKIESACADTNPQTHQTSAVGGGQAHDHGNVAGGATANTWRPLASVGIICTKD